MELSEMLWALGGGVIGGALAFGAWVWAVERQLKRAHRGLGE